LTPSPACARRAGVKTYQIESGRHCERSEAIHLEEIEDQPEGAARWRRSLRSQRQWFGLIGNRANSQTKGTQFRLRRYFAELAPFFARCIEKGDAMTGNLIYWALALIVIAIVAALLGFGGVASTAMGGAHLLIWVAVIVIIIGVVLAVMRRA
jgi:uncharacterized membrane protein YtjA (UPF0391 family)